MPQRSRRVVLRALQRKGFEPREGDHTFLAYRTTDGLLTHIVTKASHGATGTEIGTVLLAQMARQCGFGPGAVARFLQLVDCPMDQAAFERMLRESGLIGE